MAMRYRASVQLGVLVVALLSLNLTAWGQDAIHTLRGHSHLVSSAWVWSAAFSPDGTRVVTASRDKTAKIWDAESGEEILAVGGHSYAVLYAAFSPDGSRVVTASGDKTAKIWDAKTGDEILTLRGHSGGVLFAAFSPDGTRVVTASNDETAKIWDVE
jgi:WD40 repeat protein